jgi:hypothetical protein
MGATTFRSIGEEVGTAAGVAVLHDVAVREQAAERLMRDMDRAARLYERMGEQLGRVLDSDRTRRQSAWNRGTRQRMRPPAG